MTALLPAAGCGQSKNAPVPPDRLSAFSIAEMRARISGIVQKRLFTEGSDAKEGDVLFGIDDAAADWVINAPSVSATNPTSNPTH